MLAFAVGVVGCEKSDPIRTYTVDRRIEEENEKVMAQWRDASQSISADDLVENAVPGRLLGALLPHGDTTWIFKMLADRDAVSKHVAEVQGFVESVTFDGDAPKWTLPSTWREKKPAGEMRFATLIVGDLDPPLELAVSQLPGTQSVADNVNRWRGQVKLPPQSAAEAEASAIEITTAAGPARWVDLSGNYVPGKSMAPFAGAGRGGAMPADHPPLPKVAAPKTPPINQENLPVRFQAPEEWRPAPPAQFSIATFVVGDEADGVATVTISAAAGELIDNINRWRGQLQLSPIDAAALESAATPLKVDGRNGVYVESLGAARPEGQRAIYGAIIDDTAPHRWFVKITGDASAVFRERERFLTFVKSLKFVEPNGS